MFSFRLVQEEACPCRQALAQHEQLCLRLKMPRVIVKKGCPPAGVSHEQRTVRREETRFEKADGVSEGRALSLAANVPLWIAIAPVKQASLHLRQRGVNERASS